MEIDKKQQITEGWDFNIKLESEEFDERSDYWQEQCNILYNMIKTELPSGSIQPLSYKAEEGEKAELITIISTLVVTRVAAKAIDKVIDKIVDIIKMWQENRLKAKITIQYPDGGTIELSNLSIPEAKKIIKDYQKNQKINNKT